MCVVVEEVKGGGGASTRETLEEREMEVAPYEYCVEFRSLPPPITAFFTPLNPPLNSFIHYLICMHKVTTGWRYGLFEFYDVDVFTLGVGVVH